MTEAQIGCLLGQFAQLSTAVAQLAAAVLRLARVQEQEYARKEDSNTDI